MAVRRALVAGVGPSLGRAIAERLAADGCEVVLVGRREEAVLACRDAITAAGGKAVPVVAELSDPGWTATLAPLGPISIAVWVAAAYAEFARIEHTPLEAYDRVHATALRGPFLLARALMPSWRAQGFGRFVVLGSVASEGGAGQAAYASAKERLVGLVRTLAAEGGRDGVTANLVSLGWVDTGRTATFDPAVRKAFLERTARGRAATPEEVAAVVAFLASDAAVAITGATVPVDGGLGLRS